MIETAKVRGGQSQIFSSFKCELQCEIGGASGGKVMQRKGGESSIVTNLPNMVGKQVMSQKDRRQSVLGAMQVIQENDLEQRAG